MNMKMATTFFHPENNNNNMVDPLPLPQHVEYSSSSDSDDFFEEEEEVNSCSSSSSPSSRSKDSLHDMSSLLQVIPLKRGLSKHYNGKSQSFSCLKNLRCFEDLAKPENPYNKKLKSCKSYQDFDDDDDEHKNHGSNIVQSGDQEGGGGGRKLHNYKKTSRRGSCSSLCTKRNVSFINKPPIPIPIPSPHKSSSCFVTQSPLFAFGV